MAERAHGRGGWRSGSREHHARGWVQALAVAAVAVVLVEAVWRAYPLAWADAVISDAWHAARGSRGDVERPVVLIAIDDESLERITDPQLFWTVAYARAIEQLRAAGASAIGLDLLLQASAEGWLMAHGFSDSQLARTWDSPLRMQLVQGDVMLATIVAPGTGADTCLAPLPEFAALLPSADTHLGYANLGEDPDGIVRRFAPVIAQGPPSRTCPRLHMAMQLALNHLGLDPSAAAWQLGTRQLRREDIDRVPISYVGPRGSFPIVPLWRLVEEGALTAADRAAIRGRVALIGHDHDGNHDVWTTPYDRYAGDARHRMAGYEVQANAIATLVDDLRLIELGPLGRLVIFVAVGAGLALAFSVLSLEASLALVAAHTLAWPVGGYVAFLWGDVLLPSASSAALGVLVFGATYTARFSREARERRFLRDVFSRYVSDDVVAEILSSPDALELGGAVREITILFSDIRNFTTISEKLAPQEVVEMLNAYFSVACPPIVEHRGRVDKFIGDAVMAVFGAPVPRPDHARSALLAALGMARAAQEFKGWMAERFAGRDLPEFDIGVGVHTGTALAGNIGFDQAIEYAVIGDAVNTASRLEGKTKDLGVRILVSRQTVDAAGPGVRTGKTAEVALKGRAEPVQVFELLGLD